MLTVGGCALRVLFVYSDISGTERYGAKKFYSGLGSLSAVLKAAAMRLPWSIWRVR